MRPDAHIAMQRTLALGPDYCPPDLFSGPIPAVVSALKVHSATIADGRRSALADTFPRTRQLLGDRGFDSFVELHLGDSLALGRPLALIGRGFPELLSGAARDLARIEWAWLESYCAADAPALTLGEIAGMTAPAAVALKVALHPATRLVADLNGPLPIRFDAIALRTGAVLITRPEEDVRVTETSSAVAELVHLLQSPRTVGDLLERDAEAAAVLLRNDALTLSGGAER